MRFTGSNALPDFPVTTKLKKRVAIDSGFNNAGFYSQPHLGLRLLILDDNAGNSGNALSHLTYFPESSFLFY